MRKKLAIAMFGQKRLSREGGVEIVVKELCTRMAQNGCDVTCYNRAGHHVSGAEYDDAGKTEYEGIRQKPVPTIERRGACGGKLLILRGSLQCVWKIRCSTYSCRRTSFFYMAAEDVWEACCRYHSWCVAASVISGANGFWLRSILNPPQRKLIEQKTE